MSPVVAVSHGRWGAVAVGLLGLTAGPVVLCAVLIVTARWAGRAVAPRGLILVAVATVSSLGYAVSRGEVPVPAGQMPGYEGAVAGLVAARA